CPVNLIMYNEGEVKRTLEANGIHVDEYVGSVLDVGELFMDLNKLDIMTPLMAACRENGIMYVNDDIGNSGNDAAFMLELYNALVPLQRDPVSGKVIEAFVKPPSLNRQHATNTLQYYGISQQIHKTLLDQSEDDIKAQLTKWKIPQTDDNIKALGLLMKSAKQEADREFRLAADTHKEMGRAFPGNFLMYFCIQSFYGFFTGEPEHRGYDEIKITDDDIKFLKDIEQHPSTSPLNRIHAAQRRGTLYVRLGQRQAAYHRYRQASLYKAEVSNDELLGTSFGGGMEVCKVKDLFDSMMRSVKNVLLQMEDKMKVPGIKTVTGGNHGLAQQVNGVWVSKGYTESLDLPLKVVRARAEKVVGSVCDFCNKTANEAEKLMRCSKCQLAWYCSGGCQSSAWKAGHKMLCRVPFAYKRGDVVKIVDYERAPRFKGMVMEVLGLADPEDEAKVKETKWLVDLLGGCLKANGYQFAVEARNIILLIGADERGTF
ncbi:Tetratricopeptide repeat protein 28, partial [Blyttiomyces sp. JEL0837]